MAKHKRKPIETIELIAQNFDDTNIKFIKYTFEGYRNFLYYGGDYGNRYEKNTLPFIYYRLGIMLAEDDDGNI